MRKMKDSRIEWIGEIPESWEIERNKHCFDISKEIVGEASSSTELLSLTTKGVRYKSSTDTAGKVPESYDTYQYVHENDLIMCLFDLDCSAVFSGISPYHGMVSPAYRILSCNHLMNPHYADYWFQFVFVGRKFMSYSKTLRYTLTYDEFGVLPILRPCLQEQIVIAAYLDRQCAHIDNIIEKTKVSIGEYKKLRQAIITQAVTKGVRGDRPMKDSGIEWIGEIPEDWEIHKFCWNYSAMLGKMLDAKRVTGKKLHSYIKNADVQWWRINTEALDEMDFDETEYERYTLKPGDLVICEGGEIGKCAIVPNDFPSNVYYQKALHRVRVRNGQGNLQFLSYVMYAMAKGNAFNSTPEKATIAHLPGDALSQLRIPFPPVAEQNEIVSHLDRKRTELNNIIELNTIID